MRKLNYIVLFFIAFSLTANSYAQISLAPSFVFIDENSGVGNVFISNNSQKTYEVSINFVFGYPSSDADGGLVMNYKDSVASAQFALDPMVRAFPRSFFIKGGEQRTVRIQVLPNQRRKEGYFFTRMKVLAKPQAVDVSDTVAVGIGTRINFNFEQITAVFYHKGKVSTSVDVKNLDVRQNERILEIRPLLQRKGNAPFLGSMFVKLKNADGKVVSEIQSTTTVYFEEIRRIDLSLKDVAPGTYTLELSLETKRSDMASADVVQAARIVSLKTIEIK